ncbi:MAG: L-threonine 3-dehydrogenase [Candidatus Latescibacterota bacterium]
MQAIVKEKSGPGLTLADVPAPTVGDDEVLIRVRVAGICGTDVHIYDWDRWSQGRIRPPLTIGHEFVGEVVELGRAVRHVEIGQRVSAEGHITCGVCEFCRTGQGHICRDVRIIGVDRDGCFAEYISISAGNIWPVPDSIPDHIAATFDPLGNAMHTVMAEPPAGKSVLVTGAGAIGLFAVAIARYAGASRIMVIEPNAYKRDLAGKVGAELLIDPAESGTEKKILDYTEGLGPQILLEMSGHPAAIGQGFRLLRNGGTACILGIPSSPITIDWAKDIIFKGITIRAINGRRMFDTWFQSQNFMLKEQESINRLVTHHLPFRQFERGFNLLHAGEAVKVVLEI